MSKNPPKNPKTRVIGFLLITTLDNTPSRGSVEVRSGTEVRGGIARTAEGRHCGERLKSH